jgi:transposase
LAAEIAKAGEHPDVVLEATYGWYWAVDVLQEAGARVHLAHPLGVKGFAYRRVKNDQRDASDLADLLRMNRLPQAYVAPPAVFVAEIGEAGRFTDAAHLASWAGLTPKHRESDRTVRRGPITKQGSGLVRWAAVEAAQKIAGLLKGPYHRTPRP